MTKNALAKIICAMTYGELMAVATELSDANKDKLARPRLETPEDFASLLHDWADATFTDATASGP